MMALMSADQTEKPDVDPKPLPLGYGTHVGAYPQPKAPPPPHPRIAVLLISLAALAGVWSIILGVTFLGDAWLIGVLLIAAGVCLCWGTIGKTSARGRR
jgi:hypothetical protein